MSEPKFCKDCKHYKAGWSGFYPRCAAVPDPVAGGAVRFADIEREYGFGDHCGPEAKRFEAKPKAVWRRWWLAVSAQE